MEQFKVQQSKTSRAAAFTLLEMIIVAGLVAMLAALALPSALKSHSNAARVGCIANLRQIESAKTQWALEFRKSSTETPTDSDLFGLNKYLKYKPQCPANGVYTLNPNNIPPTCSIPGHTL